MMQRYFHHFLRYESQFRQIGKEQRRVHHIFICTSRTQIAEEVPSHSRRTRESTTFELSAAEDFVFHLPLRSSRMKHRQVNSEMSLALLQTLGLPSILSTSDIPAGLQWKSSFIKPKPQKNKSVESCPTKERKPFWRHRCAIQ